MDSTPAGLRAARFPTGISVIRGPVQFDQQRLDSHSQYWEVVHGSGPNNLGIDMAIAMNQFVAKAYNVPYVRNSPG